jgi:predicted nucleotidyltransferase
MVRADLKELARTLADWVSPAPNFIIYLFGSRVRGDQKPTSDVDVVIQHGKTLTEADMQWWTDINNDLFKTIDAALPGKLHILENNDPVTQLVLSAAACPYYRDRQVVCVQLPSHRRATKP